jgi:selenocysteine-specific elongation factor
MPVVIGTAGHIDHGKSALVKALTGTDPDRLKEEKERGMTTDLGFAFYRPDVTIIDVPGHEKFVRHMLAGATTIDLVMLVIAADDGIMPQTREHFEIARLLGIRRGLIVINKRDLVDDEWLALIKSDIAAMVKGSFLDGAAMMPVSSITGQGIPELRQELDKLIAGTPPKPDRGIFRLPVDRNFTMKGFGTVVAGTVLSGTARVGDKVELQPEGIETRIRGIQVHNHAVTSVTLGERAAFNLQGIEREIVLRGSILGTPGYYRPTEYLNTSFYLLKSAETGLKNMTRVRLHLGTAEIMCRLMLLDVKELTPGGEAVAQLRLESPTVADWGDRYVIRSYSPQKTIGGGTVLEANPSKARRFDEVLVARLKALSSGSVASIMEQQLLKLGFALKTADQLAREAALNLADAQRLIKELISQGKGLAVEHENRTFIIHVGNLMRARNAILETLGLFHRQNPARLGMKRQELKSKLPPDFSPVLFERLLSELTTEELIVLEAERVRLSGHRLKLDEREQALADRILKLYDETGFNSPALKDLGSLVPGAPPKQIEKVTTALFDLARIVDVGEGIVLAQKYVQEAEAKVREFLASRGQMTASEFRQMVDTSRKYAIPLLNYLDSHGVTQRRGEVRVLRSAMK